MSLLITFTFLDPRFKSYDLAQAMKDKTLGYAMFTSYNYSPALYEGFVE